MSVSNVFGCDVYQRPVGIRRAAGTPGDSYVVASYACHLEAKGEDGTKLVAMQLLLVQQGIAGCWRGNDKAAVGGSIQGKCEERNYP